MYELDRSNSEAKREKKDVNKEIWKFSTWQGCNPVNQSDVDSTPAFVINCVKKVEKNKSAGDARAEI